MPTPSSQSTFGPRRSRGQARRARALEQKAELRRLIVDAIAAQEDGALVKELVPVVGRSADRIKRELRAMRDEGIVASTQVELDYRGSNPLLWVLL